MERGLVHVSHSVGIGVVAYLLMLYVLRQSPTMAENRSVLVGAVALTYMVVFGHKAPTMAAFNHL